MAKIDWAVLLTALGLIGGFIAYLVNTSMKLGRTMESIETLSKEFEAEKLRTREKFDDYYKFKSDTNTILASINTNTNNILESIKELKLELREVRSKHE